MKPLGSALQKRVEKVDRTKHAFTNLQPITIHFDGSIDKREVDQGREYSMDLYSAHPGDIVVAKIDLKNGAVGIVPDDWHNVVVTGHFAVYDPDLAQVEPRYLHLLIQTTLFKALLWRNKVGAEGRKEVKLDFFENVPIPLPQLPIQRAILATWRKAQDTITKANARCRQIEDDLENDLLKAIGFQILPPSPRKGAFALRWNAVERWDTFFYRIDFAALESAFDRIPYIALGKALRFVSRAWEPSDFPQGSFEYVEISSVSRLDGITGRATIDVTNAPSRATTLIREGDILISTTRPYLGAFAVVPKEYDGSVCSSGFAVADLVLSHDLDKDFLMFFLKSAAGLRQFEKRMTGGLYPAIVQSELERIKVPLPPLNVQHAIMKRVATGQIEIARHRQAADRLRRETQTEVEEMILGTRPVK